VRGNIQKKHFVALASIGLALLCPRAFAQVRLPGVQLPPLPVEMPVDVNRATTTLTNGAERLVDVRRLRVSELLRTNRRVLEADPRGAPMIRNEVVAISPSEAALERAANAGFTILREQTLAAIQERVVVLQVPPRISTRAALRRLRAMDPEGTYDFNHIYVESGLVDEEGNPPVNGIAAAANPQIRVGLIDAGVDDRHPVFAHSKIFRWGCDGGEFPASHGTAVASLLVGDAPEFHGAAPGATLYAADVYCGVATGGALDAILNAFAWLAQQRVAVINVSLVGPPNALLERVVKRLARDGFLIVAAVGNDGPSAPPLYPAAYDGVVGVSAVDAHRKVIIEAERGRQVMFAAPGADMAAANKDSSYASVRGTSFAAPLVAGLLALHLRQPDLRSATQAIADLKSAAIDLGAAGADVVYGAGLVAETLRVAPDRQLLAAKR
jgi:subtilisin family serine protease